MIDRVKYDPLADRSITEQLVVRDRIVTRDQFLSASTAQAVTLYGNCVIVVGTI